MESFQAYARLAVCGRQPKNANRALMTIALGALAWLQFGVVALAAFLGSR